MKRKFKTFDFANNYIEEKVSEIIGIKTEKVGYTEDNTIYYYWYDKDDYELINVRRDEIRDTVAKLEGIEPEEVMVGVLKSDDEYYKDCCRLIVGINNY